MPFKSGKDWNGNAKGRPQAPEVKELRDAIRKVQKTKNKKLLEHFVEQAFEDKQVLIATIKKLVPDLSANDIIVEDNTIRIVIDKPSKKKHE